ncbi:transglycosylase domain-containing protein [Nocardiopsis mangrovi]|uniref:Transglycosylase domain-containing protein n=1 Tax=Nocardiopsis mangrovi TaxID=1179818 RepID=A0ABV9E2J2_9ACTN
MDARAEGARSEGRREGGRRRADDDRRRPPEGGRRGAAHGARAEGGRRGAGGGGGGRRRPPSRGGDDHDDRGPVKRFFAKAWKPALIAGGVCFVLGVAGLGIAYAMTEDPRTMDSQEGAILAATSISYADGEEALTTGEVNRVMITEEQLAESPNIVNGVLAAEQRNFYEEPGISISGTMRAVLSAGSAGGGSTITQQMARNYYDGLSQERSYMRKLREIMIAIKAGQLMDPDQILTQYLNTIYFGRNAYGVQAASQAYFNKNMEDLDASEAALLGAIIQQPGNFENMEPGSPKEEELRGRWDYVVNGMVEMNGDNADLGISQSEADELEYPEVVEYDIGENLSGYRGYIMNAVRDELANRYGLDTSQVSTQGFQVTTSLDQNLMDAADTVFDETLPEMPEETVFGLTAIDPATGEIKAFHGGDDFSTDPNNSLTLDAQAGSAFKPYVLAAGLEQGIGLRSMFNGDSPQEFEGVAQPIQNDSNRDWGPVDMVKSTARSVNTSYVQLAIETGSQPIVDIAGAAGVSENAFTTAEMGPNIALGTYRVTAADQASGFATFANEGVHMPRHMVTEVLDAEGNPVEPNDAEELESGSRAFSADAAADATYAMTQVVEEGGGDAAALPDGRPVAGKTGTSENAASAWFVGYTPQLATSVGLSRSDGQELVIPGVDNVYGGSTSAEVWREFMTVAMEGQEVRQFPEPVWMGEEGSYGMPVEPSPSPSEEATGQPTESPSADPSPSESPDPSGEPTGRPECETPIPAPDCEEENPEESPDPGNGNPPGEDEEEDDGFPWGYRRE